MRLVMSEVSRLVGPGVAIGLVLALASGRLLESLLFEVSAVDPWTYAAVAGVLTAVAWLAAYVPALRATRVDPLTSIRNE